MVLCVSLSSSEALERGKWPSFDRPVGSGIESQTRWAHCLSIPVLWDLHLAAASQALETWVDSQHLPPQPTPLGTMHGPRCLERLGFSVWTGQDLDTGFRMLPSYSLMLPCPEVTWLQAPGFRGPQGHEHPQCSPRAPHLAVIPLGAKAWPELVGGSLESGQGTAVPK